MNPPAQTMSSSALAARRNLVLAVCSIAMFTGTFVTTVVAVALPVMGPALQLSYSEALWVQAIYVLAMSVFLVPVGRLADQYGLARFFLIGSSIFGVFSIVCALATSGSFLIVARCLQGVGAGFTAATAPALVTAAFPQKERGRALGLNAMAGYLGLMAGPPLGGLIVSHASWRWIFLVNVPLVIINLVGTCCLLAPESRDRKAMASAPGAPGRAPSGAHLDWPGVALLALMLSALLVPLIFVPFWGWTSPLTLGLLVAAVILFVAFVLAEDRVRDPLLDLDLVRKNRLFAAASAAAFLNYAAVHGVTTLVAVFLEVTRGYSAQTA
ncbi:MAG: MFS transporter, partial [Anaerolineae bacterium]